MEGVERWMVNTMIANAILGSGSNAVPGHEDLYILLVFIGG